MAAKHQLNAKDDYPDYVIPLARAVAAREIERGVALCGSGVGASIAANKTPGVRAGLIRDVFSTHQGVEDDDMNVSCLGGKVIGSALAWELIETFLASRFSGADRHKRRLAKVQVLENQRGAPGRIHSRRFDRFEKTRDSNRLGGKNQKNCRKVWVWLSPTQDRGGTQ